VSKPKDTPIAVLWDLEWNANRLACRIYRHGSEMQLRIESPTAIVITEPFEMRPRTLARVRALRDGLTRRGWRESGRMDANTLDSEGVPG
jgi:hypothetical protein